MDENSEYKLPDFVGVDEYGNTSSINASDMDWSLSERIADIDDGIIEARNKSGKAVMEGVYDDGKIFIPIAVGNTEKLLEGFENTDDITLVQYPEDSEGRILNNSKSREGGKSLKLYYDFTTMKPNDQSIAFLEFGENGILLQDEPESLSMWVYGDRSDHWLRCRVTDANGTMYKVDFEKEIDWSGWKEVNAHLPEDISYPVVLNNVYVAEIYNDKADKGYIYLDGLKANYPLGCDDIEVPESSRVEDLLMDIPDEYELKLHIGDLADGDGERVYDSEDIVFVELSTIYGSLSSYNKTQWDDLLVLKEYEDKTIVIKTDIDYSNIKGSERKTFDSYLKYLNENNTMFMVSEGVEEDAYIRYEDGMRFIRYSQYFTLYLTDGEASYDYK